MLFLYVLATMRYNLNLLTVAKTFCNTLAHVTLSVAKSLRKLFGRDSSLRSE